MFLSYNDLIGYVVCYSSISTLNNPILKGLFVGSYKRKRNSFIPTTFVSLAGPTLSDEMRKSISTMLRGL
jgi:hypothetical protein